MDNYASTSTYTVSTSYTEARARAVMKSVFDDFVCFTIFNLTTVETITKWRRDILYMLDKEALKYFDIKFSAGSPRGYRYSVSSDGTLSENSLSGGINYYAYPSGTKVSIVVSLDESSSNYNEVENELIKNRGWGNNGISLTGGSQRDRAYSKDNYGVIRESFS